MEEQRDNTLIISLKWEGKEYAQGIELTNYNTTKILLATIVKNTERTLEGLGLINL